MSSKEYVQPDLNKHCFTCPQCGELCNQIIDFRESADGSMTRYAEYIDNEQAIYASACTNCGKITFWLTNLKNNKFYNQKIIYPECYINKPIPKYLSDKSKHFWDKACFHYGKDWRVTMTYLRICFENILREYFKESGTQLGNLIVKLENNELYKNSPYSKCLHETNNFLSDSTHSTCSINYEKEPIEEDVDFAFELIEDCVYRLYECQDVIDKFKQKQNKRNQKILYQKKDKNT